MTEHENKSIEEILGLLSEKHLSPVPGVELSLGTICPGQYLIMSAGQRGEVEHVGIKLFNRQIVKDYPSPVYFFVERYLLWILLTQDEIIIKNRLAEERVSIRFGLGLNEQVSVNLRQKLGMIKPDQPFIITTDNSKYTVSWLQEQQPLLTITFPIQYELIWGMNKKEVEGWFQSDLMSYLSEVKAIPKNELPTEFTLVKDSCYRSEGDFYGLPEVTSYRYYRKDKKQGYSLLFDRGYPTESAVNLFTAIPEEKLQIQITQRLYGGKREVYTISLAAFLVYCRVNGCDIYVGIEKTDDRHITGTAVMVNRSLGYNHILYFDVDNRLWDEKNAYPVTAQLYAFVPMHNVNSLYSDEKNK